MIVAVPKVVTDAMVALRAERGPLAARLDAIDLALDNLSRVWPTDTEPARRGRRAEKGDSKATQRREVVFEAIESSAAGLNGRALREQTSKMSGKDRSNAIQTLKAAHRIRRAGKVWTVA